MFRGPAAFGIITAAITATACSRSPRRQSADELPATQPPPAEASAASRLDASSRHGEWVMIATSPGDSVRAFVVYPERATKAPVVVVIHEIFGLTPWIRSVADQLAADGFIAIAPDLLTSKNLGGSPAEGPARAEATSAIQTIQPQVYQPQLEAVARYGMALPAAVPRYAVMGFCWGGSASFAHATRPTAALRAAVVYYGTSPAPAELPRVRVPVLGLYGGNDTRVNATIPAADSTLRALGRPFESHIYDGAGHGFLRAQEGSPANLGAANSAWPLTVQFLRKHLE
jgi:carboxymethylenebutenolidase